MDDIFVRVIDMPISIKGVTLLDENGDYNIYLNDRYPHEIRLATYEHEMSHIEKGDFCSEADIFEKENAEAYRFTEHAEDPEYTRKIEAERRRKRAERNLRRIRKSLQEDVRANPLFIRKRTLTDEEFVCYINNLKT